MKGDNVLNFKESKVLSPTSDNLTLSVDDNKSDAESKPIPPPSEAPILTNFVSEGNSEDETVKAVDYEFSYMNDTDEEMDHFELNSLSHEANIAPILSDDDEISIAESKLCTTSTNSDHYNRVCFLHCGYFPHRGH
uniref:Ovule protein n=1 Tax=Strongyloides venezuelensis TaxID=75913 RepID=A0A0K0F0N0_STRVS